MSAPANWLDLVERAEDDYAIAVSALRRKKPLTYPSTFHAQQCAEKYLKVLIASRDRKFSLIHDLVKLDAECESAGILTGFLHSDLAILSEYAVKTRYTGDEPSLEEAREMLEIAKTIRKFDRKILSVE